MWSSRSGAAGTVRVFAKRAVRMGIRIADSGGTIVTVLRADQTTGGTTGARPRGGADLCRLTILTPHSQIDLALPNSVPVELLVPGIADLVEKHSAANDFDVAGDRLHPTRWVLSRVGSPPLSPASTLQEHGVLDGELLVFDSVEASPPPPLFDDVMYNVAVADTGHAHPWTPRIARLTGSAIAVAAATAGAFVLLRTEGATASVIGAVAAFAMVVAFLVAGAVAGRVYDDAGAALTLGAAALPIAFAAAPSSSPATTCHRTRCSGSSWSAPARWWPCVPQVSGTPCSRRPRLSPCSGRSPRSSLSSPTSRRGRSERCSSAGPCSDSSSHRGSR